MILVIKYTINKLNFADIGVTAFHLTIPTFNHTDGIVQEIEGQTDAIRLAPN